jgi:hypothetical protein
MSWGRTDLAWPATDLLTWHMRRNRTTFAANRSGSALVLLRTGPNLHHFARDIGARNRLAPKPDHFCFESLRFCTGFTPNWSESAPLRQEYPPPGPTRAETGPVQLQTPPTSHQFYSELVRSAPLSQGYPPPGSIRTETGPVQLQTPPISHWFCSEPIRIPTNSPGISTSEQIPRECKVFCVLADAGKA